jgi:hypothetical protein
MQMSLRQIQSVLLSAKAAMQGGIQRLSQWYDADVSPDAAVIAVDAAQK